MPQVQINMECTCLAFIASRLRRFIYEEIEGASLLPLFNNNHRAIFYQTFHCHTHKIVLDLSLFAAMRSSMGGNVPL